MDSAVEGMLRLLTVIVVPAVMLMGMPLPGPGSVLKKYSAAIMLGAVIIKLMELIAVSPATVTLIVPEVGTPNGTVTVILVVVLAVTVAATPVNFTMLLAGVALKFVPVIVTGVPAMPEAGENEVMDGGVATDTTLKVALYVSVH